MTAPRRIQLSRAKGYRKPAGAIVVARPSRWGNPFRIYHGHHLIGPRWAVARDTWTHIPAAEAVAAYITSSRQLGTEEAVIAFSDLMRVRQRDEPARLREWLAPLAGHDLACWCPLDQPCHADVLLKLANAAHKISRSRSGGLERGDCNCGDWSAAASTSAAVSLAAAAHRNAAGLNPLARAS